MYIFAIALNIINFDFFIKHRILPSITPNITANKAINNVHNNPSINSGKYSLKKLKLKPFILTLLKNIVRAS